MLIALVTGAVLAASPVQAAMPVAARHGAPPPPAILLAQAQPQAQPPAAAQRPVEHPSVSSPPPGQQTPLEETPQAGQPLRQYPPSGVNPAIGGGMPAADQYRAQDLIGLPVEAADGQEIGEVGDLILNVETGTIDMLVVTAGGGLIDISEQTYAIAWPQVRVDRQRERVFLALPSDQITAGSGLGDRRQ